MDYSPQHDTISFPEQPELSMIENFTPSPSYYDTRDATVAYLHELSTIDSYPVTVDVDWPSAAPETVPRTESFSEDFDLVNYDFNTISESATSPTEYVQIATPPDSWSLPDTPQSAPEPRTYSYPADPATRRTCSGHERVAQRSRRALRESIERGRNQNLSISPWLRGPISPRFQRATSGPCSKVSKSRKREEKIQCELCPAQLSGDHEHSRHFRLIHAPEGWRWQIIDPAEKGLTPYFRIPVEIMDCKNCQSEKLYGINYNAAAHIRRVHFKNTAKTGSKGGSSGGAWPEIRYLEFLYMKLVHVQQISSNTLKPKENIDYARTGRQQATTLREPHSKRHSSVPLRILPATHGPASHYQTFMVCSPETDASPPYYDDDYQYHLPYALGGSWQPPPSHVQSNHVSLHTSPRTGHDPI